MNRSKIQLSSFEMELVTDTGWILTKNGILQKAKTLLEKLQYDQLDLLQPGNHSIPAEVTDIPPKISKGENYKGLPYLVLDHPRYFDKENIFAIRTMFWWGHHFSTTLHLSGRYKKEFQQCIIASFQFLQAAKFFVCVNKDEWEHHFEPGNYISLQEMDAPTFSETVQAGTFLKLAQKIPLQQWDDAPAILASRFDQLVSLLSDQLPKR